MTCDICKRLSGDNLSNMTAIYNPNIIDEAEYILCEYCLYNMVDWFFNDHAKLISMLQKVGREREEAKERNMIYQREKDYGQSVDHEKPKRLGK
jgi:hypothetical protein